MKSIGPWQDLWFEMNIRVLLAVIEEKPLKKWRAQGDDLRTFLAEFVAALPQMEFPAELSL